MNTALGLEIQVLQTTCFFHLSYGSFMSLDAFTSHGVWERNVFDGWPQKGAAEAVDAEPQYCIQNGSIGGIPSHEMVYTKVLEVDINAEGIIHSGAVIFEFEMLFKPLEDGQWVLRSLAFREEGQLYHMKWRTGLWSVFNSRMDVEGCVKNISIQLIQAENNCKVFDSCLSSRDDLSDEHMVFVLSANEPRRYLGTFQGLKVVVNSLTRGVVYVAGPKVVQIGGEPESQTVLVMPILSKVDGIIVRSREVVGFGLTSLMRIAAIVIDLSFLAHNVSSVVDLYYVCQVSVMYKAKGHGNIRVLPRNINADRMRAVHFAMHFVLETSAGGIIMSKAVYRALLMLPAMVGWLLGPCYGFVGLTTACGFKMIKLVSSFLRKLNSLLLSFGWYRGQDGLVGVQIDVPDDSDFICWMEATDYGIAVMPGKMEMPKTDMEWVMLPRKSELPGGCFLYPDAGYPRGEMPDFVRMSMS